MPTIDTSLGTVSYTDEGSGPPILLLHATLHDRTDFAPVLDALANGRRALALDWPGHGDSPLPAVPLRAAQFGDLLVEFADLLDLRNVVVVGGNSVGGYAACRLALERPERVAGLVLVNTGGFTPHSAFTRLVCAVMGKPTVLKTVFPVFVRAYMRAKKNPTDKAVVARVAARVKTAEGARTAAVLWKSFTEPGHDLRAEQMTAPVLITWGAEDLTAPKRWGKAVQAAIPGSRFEALPTGHVVFSSEPEAWLDTVLPFVDAAHGVRPGLQRHS